MEKEKLASAKASLLDEVLKHLKVDKEYDRYFMVHCPNTSYHRHGDRNASLKITKTGFFKCFNPSCPFHKGGHIKILAQELGIEVEEEEESNLRAKAIDYVAQRLKLSRKEAQEFMDRFHIFGTSYAGMEGVMIDLFNGDRKFRSLTDHVFRHFGNSQEPAFSGLLDVFKDNAIAVCEGTFDALTFWRLGCPAVSTEGTKYSLESVRDLLKSKGIGVVYFAFDSDEAGEKYLEDAIRLFLGRGISVYFLEIPPEYKDVNEFFLADEEGFKKALADMPRNNVFRWYVKKNSHLLDSDLGRKMLVSKLAWIYDQAPTAKREDVEGTLLEFGINPDDWLDMLERIDQIKVNEAKKGHIREVLEKARRELEYADIESVVESLIGTLRNFKTIEIRSLKERKDELIYDDITDKALRSSLFQSLFFLPSDMLLITAKTKVGKTTLALNLAKDFLDQGKKVLYVTYEISSKVLFWLFAGIPLRKNWRELTEQDKKAVLERYGDRFFIEDSLTLSDILAYVRVAQPDIFIIDYDQLILTSGRYESEERRISHIVSSLKGVALEAGSVFVLLSQVNDDDKARWSREKEFYASVHVHLVKEEKSDIVRYEVKLNRYGPSGEKGTFEIDWNSREIKVFPEVGIK